MKLRIFHNSIRLRLSRSEVTQLTENQTIKMRADLFPQPLICELAGNESDEAIATFQSGVLRITLPASQLRDWAISDQVGINAAIEPAPGRAAINLLIEKDFQCLHGDVEEQADCYANPHAAAVGE